MMADIRVTISDKDGVEIDVKKYRPGVKKRELLSSLERVHGVGKLIDSEDYTIVLSDDLVVDGEYRYVQTRSPLAEPSQKCHKIAKVVRVPAMVRYDRDNKLFELNSVYIKETAMGDETLFLYCRPEFRKQFDFLSKVMFSKRSNASPSQNPYRLGWILGPPGSGKSVTSLAFVSTIDRSCWSITWIQLSSERLSTCAQFIGDEVSTTTSMDVAMISNLLDAVDYSKSHVVFLDGLGLRDTSHLEIKKLCGSWVSEDYQNRRLVIMCSSASRVMTKIVEDQQLGIEEHFVCSWSLGDYCEALRFDKTNHPLSLSLINESYSS